MPDLYSFASARAFARFFPPGRSNVCFEVIVSTGDGSAEEEWRDPVKDVSPCSILTRQSFAATPPQRRSPPRRRRLCLPAAISEI
jgi:hypothetical protein